MLQILVGSGVNSLHHLWNLGEGSMPENPIRFASEVLKKLGAIKNELLAFGVIGILILIFFATISLDLPYTTPSQKVAGMIMHLSSIPMLLLFGGFYCYAYVFLPPSSQAMSFGEEGVKIAKQHERITRLKDPKEAD